MHPNTIIINYQIYSYTTNRNVNKIFILILLSYQSHLPSDANDELIKFQNEKKYITANLFLGFLEKSEANVLTTKLFSYRLGESQSYIYIDR